METHKATGSENALTLAFEKSATRETKIFHPWRYFVAGGETLAKIEQVITEFGTVAQATEELTKKLGAKRHNGSYGTEFEFDAKDMVPLAGTERVDYQLRGGDGTEAGNSSFNPLKRVTTIPDFVVSVGRTYGQFHPDVSTERGRQIRDEMKEIQDRSQPMVRFAQWLGAYGVDVPIDPQYSGNRQHLSATATKIGNEWIVSVPVEVKPDPYPAKTYSEEWKVPPGSKPLEVSEYFELVEKANLLKNTPKAPKN